MKPRFEGDLEGWCPVPPVRRAAAPARAQAAGLTAARRVRRTGRQPFVLLLLIAVLAQAGRVQAQVLQAPGWSTPSNLSGTPSDSQFPALVSDPAGGAHLFWAEDTEPSQANTDVILYAHWDGARWSTPVDIVLSPEGPQSSASYPAAVYSSDGLLHLAWVGGWDGRIYYSSAWAGVAGSARAWSRPSELNPGGERGSAPSLGVDETGILHLAYAVSREPSQGVYYLRSEDGGDYWSAPQVIPGSRLGSDAMLADTRLATAADGSVHVVWSWAAYPETFPPKGIYYAASIDGGHNWTEPSLLSSGPFNCPTITTRGDSEVHVVWSGTADQRSKFHTWSADGGRSWSPPTAVLTPGGQQGYAGLALDSADTIHWVTVTSRRDSQDALVHLAWDGTQWSSPEVALSMEQLGFRVDQNLSNAAIAISRGNQLEVVVMAPVGEGDDYQHDIYHVSAQANSPQEAMGAIPDLGPTAPSLVGTEPEPTRATAASPAPPSAGGVSEVPASPPGQRTLDAILTGVGFTVFVLATAAALRASLRRR